MVFKCENQDLLLHKKFMHLVLGHPKNNSPMLYFTGVRYLPLPFMDRNMKWRGKKYVQVASGIRNVKTMTFYFNTNICT